MIEGASSSLPIVFLLTLFAVAAHSQVTVVFVCTKSFWSEMSLSFIVALFLAWPTFGLSLVAWFAWLYWSAHSKAKASRRSQALTMLLEPLFETPVKISSGSNKDPGYTISGYVAFVQNLALPYSEDIDFDESMDWTRSERDEEQIGRLIMKFFSHHPEEAEKLIKACKEGGGGRAGDWATPDEVLDYENYGAQTVRMTAFRAVKALMTNNNLACFDSVNLKRVSEALTEMEEGRFRIRI